MKIAISINTSWNIYNFRAGLIKSLITEGHQVITIAPEDDFSGRLVDELGCQFEPVEMENTGSNPIKDALLFLQLRKIYKKVKADVILHYTVKPNIFGTLAASSLGIPVINNVSGLGTVFINKSLSSKIAKWLYTLSFKRANLVFFQNPDDRADFLLEIKLPNLKTDLLPGSGVNLDYYKPEPLNESRPFIFLMISRLIIDKGLYEYIEAAEIIKKEYPETEFQLLGELDEKHARGVPYSYIKEKIDAGTINYLGISDDVRLEIKKSHCIVLPSYREGTPKTLLEAAALSRPIVATDVPGCREVVREGENGFLCKVKDSNSLSHSLERVLKLDFEQLNRMGNIGRELIENKFDEQIVIKKYIYHILKLIKPKSL